jgi:thioredoxin-like negative regulator of GroEL
MNRMRRRLVFVFGVAGALTVLGVVGWRSWLVSSTFQRAERACANRNWSLAIQILGPFLDRNPNHVEARLVMARAQFGSGEWREGFEQLQLIPEGSPYLGEAKYYEGLAMIQLDRAAQAERAFRTCLVLDPESIPARQQLIALFAWEDRRLEARQFAWEVYDRAPPEHRADALSQLFQGDYGEIPLTNRRTRLETFVAHNANDWDATTALANLYAADPDPSTRARAAPMLHEVLRQEPDNVDCRMALVALMVGEDNEQARQLLREWPAESRDERYVLTQGVVQQECDLDFASAAASFRRVLDSQPDHWRARGRLAVCLRMLGQSEQANLQMKRQSRVSDALKEDAIRQLLEDQLTQLNTAALRYRLGQVYETVGRFKEARYWYYEALAVEPTHQDTKDALESLKDKPDVQPVDEP